MSHKKAKMLRGKGGAKELARVLRVKEDFPGMEVTVGASPEGKLSAALLELVEPYREDATNQESFASLVQLGVTAWNLSMFQDDERQEHKKNSSPISSRPRTRRLFEASEPCWTTLSCVNRHCSSKISG